jgi:Ca2+-binding RTX toxin-like protein
MAITGTPDNDRLRGTPLDDVILGAAGNDTIEGLSGNDNLQGGNDNDRIEGGNGDDTIFGGLGNDIIEGDGSVFENFFGNDEIFAGDGNDTVEGGRGDDLIKGEAGNDSLIGGADADTLIGGAGNDTLIGDDRQGSAGDRLVGVDDLRFLVRPGQGEIDRLSGGAAGTDVFVLGDVNRVYYNDGAVGSGLSDFAVITSFNDNQDVIELKGGVTYTFGSVSNLPGGVSGMGIFAQLEGGSELIGVVQGVQASQLQITNRPAGQLTTIT